MADGATIQTQTACHQPGFDGHTEIARQAAAERRANPALRDLTADELDMFAAAYDAGASIRWDHWAEYLNGTVAHFPLYWATYVGTLADNAGVVAAADALEARKAEFLVRIETGDLRALTLRVQADMIARSVGAQAEAA